jgi:hypothetical protein
MSGFVAHGSYPINQPSGFQRKSDSPSANFCREFHIGEVVAAEVGAPLEFRREGADGKVEDRGS